MNDISTRLLRAMVTLDDLRHFSLAAERCHVTQSALSQMIGNLGVSLVPRAASTLSPAATAFIRSSR